MNGFFVLPVIGFEINYDLSIYNYPLICCTGFIYSKLMRTCHWPVPDKPILNAN
jgi:hypothetical protein